MRNVYFRITDREYLPIIVEVLNKNGAVWKNGRHISPQDPEFDYLYECYYVIRENPLRLSYGSLSETHPEKLTSL